VVRWGGEVQPGGCMGAHSVPWILFWLLEIYQKSCCRILHSSQMDENVACVCVIIVKQHAERKDDIDLLLPL